MTTKQRKALKKSIQHWQRMRDEINCGEWPVADDCPCCAIWYYAGQCQGCPISEFTGEDGCLGTPYAAAAMAHEWAMECRTCKTRKPGIVKWEKAATEMIEFMERILGKAKV